MTPPDILRDSRLRLEQAEEHLAALQSEVLRYAERRPYVAIIENESNLNAIAPVWHTLPATQRTNLGIGAVQIKATNVQPLPDRVSLLVSDIVHSLRCALDNLAWSVVDVASRCAPVSYKTRHKLPTGRYEPSTTFSIRDKPPLHPTTELSPNPLLYPFTTVAIETFMDGLQPYHAGNPRGEMAALIRNLSNSDKHQSLHVAIALLGPFRCTITFPNGVTESLSAGGQYVWINREWNAVPFEEGTVIGGTTIATAMAALTQHPGKMKVDTDVSLTVTLDEPGTLSNPAEPVTNLCRRMIDFVRDDVVNGIAPLL